MHKRILCITLLSVFGLSAGTTLAAEDVNERFEALDLNRDGFIDRSEATRDPLLRKRWNSVDTNDNERLNYKEFKKFEKVSGETFPFE